MKARIQELRLARALVVLAGFPDEAVRVYILALHAPSSACAARIPRRQGKNLLTETVYEGWESEAAYSWGSIGTAAGSSWCSTAWRTA